MELGHGHEPVEGVGGVHLERSQPHHLLLLDQRQGEPPRDGGPRGDELRILRDVVLHQEAVSRGSECNDNYLASDHGATWQQLMLPVDCGTCFYSFNI